MAKFAAADLLQGLAKIEKGSVTKQGLKDNMHQSAGATGTLLHRACRTGKVKGFKPNASTFPAYLIPHEWHHRGEVMLSLKQSGHAIDQKTQYGLWK